MTTMPVKTPATKINMSVPMPGLGDSLSLSLDWRIASSVLSYKIGIIHLASVYHILCLPFSNFLQERFHSSFLFRLLGES